MFWGMTLHPGVEYTREIIRQEYLTLASLDCRPQMNRGETNLTAYLVLKCDNYDHVLCTLVQGRAHQQILNFVLQEGEKMTLTVEGSGIVHVTGYTLKQAALNDEVRTKTEPTSLREVSDGIQDSEALSPNPSSEDDDESTIIDEDVVSEIKCETLDDEAVNTEEGPDHQVIHGSTPPSDAMRDGSISNDAGTAPEETNSNMDADDDRHSAESSSIVYGLMEGTSNCSLYEKVESVSKVNQHLMGINSLLTRHETEDAIDSDDTPCVPPESPNTNITTNDHRGLNRENFITNNNLMQDTCNNALNIKEEPEQISHQFGNCKNTVLSSNQTEGAYDSDVSTHSTSESSNRGTHINRQPNREDTVSNSSIVEDITNYISYFKVKQEPASDQLFTSMHTLLASKGTVDSDESTHEIAESSDINMDTSDCRGPNRKDTVCTDDKVENSNAIMTNNETEGAVDCDKSPHETAESLTVTTDTNDCKGRNREGTDLGISIMENITVCTSEFEEEKEQVSGQHLISTNATMTCNEIEGTVDSDKSTPAATECSTIDADTHTHKRPSKEGVVPADSVMENISDYISGFEEESTRASSGQSVATTNITRTSNETEGAVDSNECTYATAQSSALKMDANYHSQSPDDKGERAAMEQTVGAETILEGGDDSITQGAVAYHQEEFSQTSYELLRKNGENAVNLEAMDNRDVLLDSGPCQAHWKTKRCVVLLERIDKLFSNHADSHSDGTSSLHLNGEKVTVRDDLVVNNANHTMTRAITSQSSVRTCYGRTLFKCQVCLKTFSTMESLTRHSNIHIVGKFFESNQSGEKFIHQAKLKTCKRNHTGQNKYKSSLFLRKYNHREHISLKRKHICRHCGMTFTRSAYLYWHERMHFVEKPLKCKYCNKTCFGKIALLTHENQHTTQKTITCEFCNEKFSHKWNLQVHKKIHIGEKRFECKSCDKKFRTKHKRDVHARIHTGEKPYTCSYCNKKFHQKGACNFHEIIHTRGKPFTCEHCGRKFYRNKDLKEHERNHTGEMPYQCKHCGLKCISVSSLHAHEAIHTGKKTFTCERCDKKFYTKSSLIRHERIHTGEKLFTCKFCKKKFNQKSYLTLHERIHTDEKPYSCEHCGKRFRWRRTLLVHENVQIGVNPPRGEHCPNLIRHKANLSDNENRNSDGKPFTCGYCYERFSQLAHLTEHEGVHCPEKPFTCEHCNKKFIHKGSLQIHEKIHTDEEAMIRENCKEKFNQKDLLEHERVHNSEKPFSCKHCDEKFSQKDHLQVHERSHAAEKLFTCAHCNEKFSQKDYLQEHEKVHNKEKLFTCTQCDEKFSQKDHLQEHERSHTGNRLFTCKHCNEKFGQKEHLQVHEKVHTEEEHFTCKHCSKVFSHESVLKLHERSHAWEKPFKCEHCYRRFSSEVSLEMHKSCHTGVKPSTCKQ